MAMTAELKATMQDRWLPVVVAVFGAVIVNAVIVGVAYGRLEERAANEARIREMRDNSLAQEIMPLEQRVRVFVTRAEWDLRNATRDTELRTDKENWLKAIDDLKTNQREMGVKLDQLLLMRK